MSNNMAAGYEDSLCIEGAYSSSGCCIFGASFWAQKKPTRLKVNSL